MCVSFPKVGVLNVEITLKLRIYRSLKSLICLKWIRKKFSTTHCILSSTTLYSRSLPLRKMELLDPIVLCPSVLFPSDIYKKKGWFLIFICFSLLRPSFPFVCWKLCPRKKSLVFSYISISYFLVEHEYIKVLNICDERIAFTRSAEMKIHYLQRINV